MDILDSQDLTRLGQDEDGWNAVAPLFERERQEAADLYRQLEGSERASDDLDEVVPAAHYGKVDTLFVAQGLERWGSFDPEANRLAVHEEAEAGDEDLLGLAAVQTLLHDGTVYAVEPEQVPGDRPLAALFRY